jgi:hypothetical protein
MIESSDIKAKSKDPKPVLYKYCRRIGGIKFVVEAKDLEEARKKFKLLIKENNG